MIELLLEGTYPGFMDYLYRILFPAGIFTLIYSFSAIIVLCLIIFVNKKNNVKSIPILSLDNIKRNPRDFLNYLLLRLFFPPVLIASTVLAGLLTEGKKESDNKRVSRGYRIARSLLAVLPLLIISIVVILSFTILRRFSLVVGFPVALGALFLLIYGCLHLINTKALSKIGYLVNSRFLSVSVFAAFLLIYSYGSFYHPVTPPGAYQNGNADEMTVMTYNIRNAGTGEKDPVNDWENRKEDMLAYMDGFSPHVFGVQEAYARQLVYIKNNMLSRNYELAYAGREQGGLGDESVGIYWDADLYEMVNSGTFWLSSTPNIPSKQWDRSNYRIASWVHLRIKGEEGEFFLFNTHFSYRAKDNESCPQRQSIHLLQETIDTITGDLPVFLLGDFNFHDDTHSYDLLHGEGIKPVYDALKIYGLEKLDHTTTTTDDFRIESETKIFKRIDYIFVSDGIDVRSGEINNELRDGNYAYSDHLPVIIKARLPVNR